MSHQTRQTKSPAKAAARRYPTQKGSEGVHELNRLTHIAQINYILIKTRNQTQYKVLIVGKINLSHKTTTADIARFLEIAKNDFELKALIDEIRRQGKRVFSDGFSIRLDETIMSKNFRNRVFIRIS